MKILLVYHLRLGDIIRLFPVAHHYAAHGHEVCIECNPQYWSIFKAISYAKPVPPGASVNQRWAAVFNPQIWPARYDAFRASGKTWMDFIYQANPEWAGISRKIVFDLMHHTPLTKLMEDYQLEEGYQCIFPFCYSSAQISLSRIFNMAGDDTDMDPDRCYLFMDRQQRQLLLDSGFNGEKIRCVDTLGNLPFIIAGADAVLTVNTSTTIIASAVRDPDPAKARYFHIKEPNQQDDWQAPNQTVLIP